MIQTNRFYTLPVAAGVAVVGNIQSAVARVVANIHTSVVAARVSGWVEEVPGWQWVEVVAVGPQRM